MGENEAIERFVADGDSVYTGYTSVAFGLCRAIARAGKRNLEVVGGSVGIQGTMLVMAGCADRVRAGYIASALRPGAITAMMESGELKYEDYSNQAIALMLMAGALGIPFIPTKSFLGTDYLDPKNAHHPGAYLFDQKWREMESPFDGQKFVALPALKPDVAVLHAQRADKYGNVQAWGHQGDAKWAYWAAKKPIVSVEEIVDTEVIRADPGRTIVPGFKVAAVVHMPWGAHPSGLTGYYDFDYGFNAKMGLGRVTRSKEEYADWAAEWLDPFPDHAALMARYVELYGQDTLDAVRVDAGPVTADGISYGHGRNLRFRMDP